MRVTDTCLVLAPWQVIFHLLILVLTQLSPRRPYEVGAAMPILQMRELRCREVSSIASQLVNAGAEIGLRRPASREWGDVSECVCMPPCVGHWLSFLAGGWWLTLSVEGVRRCPSPVWGEGGLPLYLPTLRVRLLPSAFFVIATTVKYLFSYLFTTLILLWIAHL